VWGEVSRGSAGEGGRVVSRPGLVEIGYQWPTEPQVFRVVGYRNHRLGDFSYTQQIFSYPDSAGAKPGRLLLVRFPLSAPFMAFAAYPTIVLLRGHLRRRRRRRARKCTGCAYDLTSNVSGVCPECGRVVEG